MFSCFLLIILGFIGGSWGLRQDDFSRNQLFAENSVGNYLLQSQKSKQYLDNNIYHTNVYDDYSSGIVELRPPLHILHSAKATSPNEKIAIKVHKPREDPKLFYQSKTYLEEINGKNNEVTFIYPGREVVRADEKFRIPKHLLRSGYENNHFNKLQKICIQCPPDETLIAKKGMDKVFVQNPILKTCSGRRAPRYVNFTHMYGPKFGSLLGRGTHVILGRIKHNNETLKLCKTEVHIIVQTCPTPKYLITQCNNSNVCKFRCRDNSLQLQGESTLLCGDDLTWEGHLPLCKAYKWCKPIPPPDYGQISCRGTTVGYTAGLSEGSRCRIRCPVGLRWYPKSVAVCRRGNWTSTLNCITEK